MCCDTLLLKFPSRFGFGPEVNTESKASFQLRINRSNGRQPDMLSKGDSVFSEQICRQLLLECFLAWNSL
ncbi:hypothetical protein MAR_009645 [Mya arenaria]|uniref:Uncharacterized protein n=1 Tax=Mya arenaria TaxID=6604 RepID=A0ABY7E2R8_MYAAR|nr:hypothetical protein MAR_009645 [Mya arenaria]